MSFGRESNYVMGSGVEVCHLVGNRNKSFGRASKYVIWSESKYVNCVYIYHLVTCHMVVRRNMSSCRATIEMCHLVGRRNMSFGRASKYVIWSGVEIYHLVICHLVGRRNLSFGRVSTYVNWSGVELCHLVGCDTLSGFEIYHLVRR